MEVSTYFEVKNMVDVPIIRHKVTFMAEKLGFAKTAVAEIAIVITELATNLVVHNCKNGIIWASKVSNFNDTGLEIISCDQGPGIASIERALLDNHSTAGSMGSGLGAIKRLMDEFDIHSISSQRFKEANPTRQSIGGTIILAKKWLSGKTPMASWQYGAVSRPLPGFIANGDAFYIADHLDNPLIFVIDSLGHGPEAEKGSLLAIDVIKTHNQDPLDKLFERLHKALLYTRGMALAAIKLNVAAGTFTHVAIGNVEIKIFPPLVKTPLPQPGVLGKGRLPPLRLGHYPWSKNSTLIFYSDGISRKWSFQVDPELLKCHPAIICHYLMREFGKPNDDATAVVIKG